MKTQRLKQFAASFLVVLSLCVSSIAACGCLHHQEKAEIAAPSCHQHQAENQSGKTNQSAKTFLAFEADDNCVCAASAPRVFAKSEIVKIEKQAASISSNITVFVELTTEPAAVEISDYAKPFYLSDSFYNIKSPRAPPVL